MAPTEKKSTQATCSCKPLVGIDEWEAQRKVSMSYLIDAARGWSDAYHSLTNRGCEAEAREALAVARILRATMRALFHEHSAQQQPWRGPGGEYLSDASASARGFLEGERRELFARAGRDLKLVDSMHFHWAGPDGQPWLLPHCDVASEKGTETRTSNLLLLLGTIAASVQSVRRLRAAETRSKKSATKSEEKVASIVDGIAQNTLLCLQFDGVLREHGIDINPPERWESARKKAATAVHRALDDADVETTSDDLALKVLRNLLGARYGLGLRKDAVKSLLSFIGKRVDPAEG